MKKMFFSFCFSCLFFLSKAQDGNLSITSGANLNLTGSATLVLQDVDFVNSGQFEAGTSTVIFSGNQAANITSNGNDFYKLLLDKTAGANLLLKDDLNINQEFIFAGNGNLLEVDSSDFFLQIAATLTSNDSNNFILTDSTGSLIKEALNSFTFPLGASSSSYNPISIVQSDTIDDIGVRCLLDAQTEGVSGIPFTKGVVATSWEIVESIPGNSNLALTAEWLATDELSGFNRNDCGLASYSGNGDWHLSPENLTTATGSDPFSQTIYGVEPGIFIVSDDTLMNQVLVELKVFLQGPYNGSTMNDQIRNAGNLPFSTPYGSGKFSNNGRGGGEVAASTAFDTNGDDSVVDWVFVWLKDAIDPALTLQTKSALLQKDGDVVDLDGISPLKIPGDSAQYHIGIGHRNHLSVRTPSAINLKETSSTSYNFSSGAGQAYGTNPMAEQSGVFLLWGGNTNENNTIRITGPPVINDYSTLLSFLGSSTNVLFNQYAPEDVNMDGTVRATGPPIINDYSKLLNILGSPNSIITEQF